MGALDAADVVVRSRDSANSALHAGRGDGLCGRCADAIVERSREEIDAYTLGTLRPKHCLRVDIARWDLRHTDYVKVATRSLEEVRWLA